MSELLNVTLMNKNTPVMNFTGEVLYNEEYKLPGFSIKEASFIDKNLCPPCIFSEERIVNQSKTWFEKRLISGRRNDLPQKDIHWINEKKPHSSFLPHFFSLTDHYWIRYTKEEEWKDLNFFTNSYNSLMGDTLFSKNINNLPKLQMSFESPDMTTNGVLKKRWKRKKDKNILIKHMSVSYQQEPMNEILVSNLLKKFQTIPFVEYFLYIEGYDLCCACENFVDENTEFIPAWYIYTAVPKDIPDNPMDKEASIYSHLMKCINHFRIPDAEDFIDGMIIIDKQTMNFDRHLGNFGFLRDVNTGEFLGPAPLFDFGNAFFAEDEYKEVDLKFFSDREKQLTKEGKIKPLDLNLIINDIKEYPYLSKEAKDRLLLNLEKNNEYIEKQNAELDKNKKWLPEENDLKNNGHHKHRAHKQMQDVQIRM